VTSWGDCPLCDEPVGEYEAWMPMGTPDGPGVAHRECSLREVIGGIGHLIAHEYWCTQRHDPDAGLTYRQSARLTLAYVETMGVEAAAER
jgi:hypothetical protein